MNNYIPATKKEINELIAEISNNTLMTNARYLSLVLRLGAVMFHMLGQRRMLEVLREALNQAAE